MNEIITIMDSMGQIMFKTVEWGVQLVFPDIPGEIKGIMSVLIIIVLIIRYFYTPYRETRN